MPIRTLVEVKQRFHAAAVEPQAGDAHVDLRQVVRMQNALDVGIAQALADLERAAAQDRLKPGALTGARHVSFPIARRDVRTNTVALREAQARLKNMPGIVEASISAEAGSPVGYASFKLADDHPVRLRIAQLCAGKPSPEAVAAAQTQRFVAAVFAARPALSAEQITQAQARLLDRVFSNTRDTTFEHRWVFAGPLDAYFPGEDRLAGLAGPVDIGRAQDALEVASKAFAQAGVHARLYLQGGVVHVVTTQDVPGHKHILRLSAPPGLPRPAQDVIDAAVAFVEGELDAAIELLVQRMPGAAFDERFSSRPKVAWTASIAVDRAKWAPNALSSLVLVDEVRRSLAAAGFHDVDVSPEGDGGYYCLRFTIRLPGDVTHAGDDGSGT